MEYKTANGIVQPSKKTAVAEDYFRWIQQNFDLARLVVQYPGDVTFNLVFRTPIEGTDLRDMLDRLAQKQRTVFDDGEEGEGVVGVPVPYSFTLVRWAAKDPESVSLGHLRPEQADNFGGM